MPARSVEEEVFVDAVGAELDCLADAEKVEDERDIDGDVGVSYLAEGDEDES